MTRRGFLAGVVAGATSIFVVARSARAQGGGSRPGATMRDSSMVRDTTNLFAMDQSAAKPVTLPPKPGATSFLTNDQRDDVEHHIRCQCGCTLDVFACRTTDFSCQVSPAMHRDVMALVKGGYNAQEIIDAFVGAYGERVLMAPKKSGFGLLAWFVPGAAVVVGGVVVAILLKSWKRPASGVSSGSGLTGLGAIVDATPDELARLDAAVKSGDD
ncbi:MAG: cytochrome c-type biogenesis protein CcmH [Gemmatimonadaceae bacterium]